MSILRKKLLFRGWYSRWEKELGSITWSLSIIHVSWAPIQFVQSRHVSRISGLLYISWWVFYKPLRHLWDWVSRNILIEGTVGYSWQSLLLKRFLTQFNNTFHLQRSMRIWKTHRFKNTYLHAFALSSANHSRLYIIFWRPSKQTKTLSIHGQEIEKMSLDMKQEEFILHTESDIDIFLADLWYVKAMIIPRVRNCRCFSIFYSQFRSCLLRIIFYVFFMGQVVLYCLLWWSKYVMDVYGIICS